MGEYWGNPPTRNGPGLMARAACLHSTVEAAPRGGRASWHAPGAERDESETVSHLHRPVQVCIDLIVSKVSNQRGKQQSIYVRAEDLDLWRRAEAYARERRMTASGLVMAALERYLNAEDPESGKDDSPR